MSDLAPAERPLPQLPPAMPWWVLPGLGGVVLAIFAGGVIGVFIIGDGTNLTSMIQAIINATMLVLGFWFGSSNSSQKKDEAMARISIDAATGKKGP